MSVRLSNIAWRATLPLTQKIVLLALCDMTNEQGDGTCFPSLHLLMDRCSLSERATRDALASLECGGYLARAFRPGTHTVYRVSPAGGVYPGTTCPTTPASPAPPKKPTPAPHAPPPAPHAPPPNNKETEGNQKKKTAAVEPLGADDLVAEGVSSEVAIEFIALRQRLKAPLTPLAWRGLKREVDKAGWSLDDALTKCVVRKWQGFEAAWVDSRRVVPRHERPPQMSSAESTAIAKAMLFGKKGEVIDV